MDEASPFEIISPNTTHETMSECLVINWKAKFPALPEDPQGSQATENQKNLYHYVASDKHAGGYCIKNPCEWCLQLNPCYIENGKRYFSLFIELHKFLRINKDPKGNTIYVIYECQVLDSSAGPIVLSKQSSIHMFSEDLPGYGFRKLIPFPHGLKYMQGMPNRELCVRVIINMFTDVDFKIACTIKDKIDSEESAGPSLKEQIQERNLVNCQVKKVVSDLFDSRHNDKTCDVIIRSKTADHPAHLNILIARSALKNFPDIIQEGDKKIILCKGYPSSAVNAFLKLCYKGYTQYLSTFKNAAKIYRLTKEFDMTTLKRHCCVEMVCNLESKPEMFFAVSHSVISFQDHNFTQGMRPFFKEFYFKHYKILNKHIKAPLVPDDEHSAGRRAWNVGLIKQLFL